MSAAPLLLVDDDEVLSQVLRRVLTREGYDVIEAGSIAQALEAAQAHPPVLGLLDLSLPDGDGIDLAKRLRAQGLTCPFLLITAYPLRLRDDPELANAFTRILTKPLNLQELRQAIDAALANPASTADLPAQAPQEASTSTLAPRPEPEVPPPTVAPPPRGRLRGVLLGGVILAGLAFFCLVVVFPALHLPGVGDWFGKAPTPTAAAPGLPAAELIEGDPNGLRMSPEVAKGLRVQAVAVEPPKEMEDLTLTGSLNFDPDYLTHVHALFPGEVTEIGPYKGPYAYSSEPKRPLRFGDPVEAGQLLAVIYSRDLGEKKNDLIEALAKWYTDQESLTKLEELYKELATSEANLRLQRSAVAADLSAVDRARNALLIWGLEPGEVQQLEKEAKEIYDRRTKMVQSGEKAPPSFGDWRQWSRLEVKAKFAGTIVERNVAKTGEIVDTNTDLFKIADMTHLAVWANVYADDLPKLARFPEGPIPWTVHLVDSPTPEDPAGRVLVSSRFADKVGPIIDPNQHTALLIGKVDNNDSDPNRRLKAGEFIAATIQVPPRTDVVAVPDDAVDEDGSESVVFVQPDPHTPVFTMRRVRVVQRMQGRVYVLTAPDPSAPKGEAEKYDYLHSGDRVVTQGVVVLKSTLEDLQERQQAEK